MLVEAAKITNESNQNQKPNYQVRGDPYVGKKESTKRCVLTPKHVEDDQTGTGARN